MTQQLQRLPPIVEEPIFRGVVVDTFNEIIRQLGGIGSFTITANAATTTVNDESFQATMVPLLIPTSANAAAAIATTYVSSRVNGSFVLTHANNAQVDRTFLYVLVG